MGTITYSAYHCVIYSALKRYKQDYDALNLETIDSLSKQKESDLSFETHLFICSTRLQETQIVIVLLTCSFIEALANFYLSLKTTPDQFDIIQNTSLIDKWIVVPSLFLKDYTFPKGEKIYNDLKELIGRRNAITHCKPQVIIDDVIALKGNLPIKYKKSHEFMDSCMSLPKRLVDHLGKFDKSIHIDHLQSSMVDFITMSNEEIAVQKYVSEWASNRKKTDGV